MSELVPFSFEGFEIRAVLREGEPLFVARDVASLLGYQDTDQAVRTHCRSAASCPVEMTGQVRTIRVIPERDVYRLIMRSRMPNAEAFEEWVVGEVLPSIRRTGSYAPAPVVPQTLAQALRLAADQAEEIDRQREQLAIAGPKAAALDRLDGTDGSMSVTAAAKVLKMPPRQLFQLLRQRGWIYRRPNGRADLGYQDKVAAGLLEHKPTHLQRDDRPDKVVEQVLVTAKGLSRLAQMVTHPTTLSNGGIGR